MTTPSPPRVTSHDSGPAESCVGGRSGAVLMRRNPRPIILPGRDQSVPHFGRGGACVRAVGASHWTWNSRCLPLGRDPCASHNPRFHTLSRKHVTAPFALHRLKPYAVRTRRRAAPSGASFKSRRGRSTVRHHPGGAAASEHDGDVCVRSAGFYGPHVDAHAVSIVRRRDSDDAPCPYATPMDGMSVRGRTIPRVLTA